MRLATRLTLLLYNRERVCNRCRINDALLQTLYEYIQISHNILVLLGQSSEDNRPLSHDIIAYINTLPVCIKTGSDHNFMAPPIQLDLLLTEPDLAQVDNNFLGSISDLQEFSSFTEADLAEAARLRR
ncbi:hypothetical protein COCC4DRAFT_155227 [Bipolaris maydis ATCC 48331]|uniref:Uncharacterized protein n=2 Tax=Cochliobolus heterostrophus TaxID=5016 RepID=M2SKP8_COCH5|nr:uncharacterized protein COCC4DRAFT_155227 [Bipolaris maydis ATCC 48331]EMD85865.1 hypothetical protein COCHEDRAFT_1160814 [Bipolaris maydis C5]ENH98663.1 hypothetical protein COCC4DRAFT_155227 [Bipolaris maydis ATCC 48331]